MSPTPRELLSEEREDAIAFLAVDVFHACGISNWELHGHPIKGIVEAHEMIEQWKREGGVSPEELPRRFIAWAAEQYRIADSKN